MGVGNSAIVFYCFSFVRTIQLVYVASFITITGILLSVSKQAHCTLLVFRSIMYALRQFKSLPYQDTKYFVVKKPCWTFLLFSKCISRIHDHFQKWQILFPIVCTDCTVITVRSTNKKLIALYYYYGQTVDWICLFFWTSSFGLSGL